MHEHYKRRAKRNQCANKRKSCKTMAIDERELNDSTYDHDLERHDAKQRNQKRHLIFKAVECTSDTTLPFRRMFLSATFAPVLFQLNASHLFIIQLIHILRIRVAHVSKHLALNTSITLTMTSLSNAYHLHPTSDNSTTWRLVQNLRAL